MFEYEINSGIPMYEVIDYFKALADWCSKNEENFYGDGWEVRLIVMPDAIHRSIIIPRTRIVFTGDRKRCEDQIAAYRKAFMRGGA